MTRDLPPSLPPRQELRAVHLPLPSPCGRPQPVQALRQTTCAPAEGRGAWSGARGDGGGRGKPLPPRTGPGPSPAAAGAGKIPTTTTPAAAVRARAGGAAWAGEGDAGAEEGAAGAREGAAAPQGAARPPRADPGPCPPRRAPSRPAPSGAVVGRGAGAARGRVTQAVSSAARAEGRRGGGRRAAAGVGAARANPIKGGSGRLGRRTHPARRRRSERSEGVPAGPARRTGGSVRSVFLLRSARTGGFSALASPRPAGPWKRGRGRPGAAGGASGGSPEFPRRAPPPGRAEEAAGRRSGGERKRSDGRRDRDRRGARLLPSQTLAPCRRAPAMGKPAPPLQ